ncbi:hypothetical protein Bca52824_052099 [Brassica carinata]|uniref:DYW domain-containing protein n=1 Tax=Brassica carinata TaxID=52824 RepID=A0A8X7R1R0_BRACI|nr:hypothetical protein Bca52824_052099 [Brassica carinata]
MQRISISISGIRRFSVTSPSPSSASNHVTLAGKKAFSFLDSDQTFPRNYHHQSPLYKVSSFLGSCKSQSNSKSVLLQAHAHILKLGYGTHPTLVASIVAAYRRCNLPHIARRLLTRFLSLSPGVSNTNLVIESLMINGECGLAKKVLRKASDRNVITWNLMIGGYVRNVQYEEALKTLKDMISFSDIKPNKFSFASALAACARLGDLNRAKWVHSLMMTDGGVELNPILCTALVDVYAKCGHIKTSREVFYGVERDDVSVWNAMITGFATHGLAEEAIRVFSEMEGQHVSPDSITFLGMLTACSHCGLLEEGKGYFDLMSQRYSIQPKLEHYGAMVDLLGRGGKVKEAYELIESMPVEPDLVIWRSLLSSSRTYKNPKLAETAIQNLSKARSGDYVLLSNIYSSTKKWESAQKVRELMKREGIRKAKGKSWVEFGGVIHRFKAGDASHVETKGIYKLLEELIQRTKSQGFVPVTDLVLMDVSEEEKEENLNYHSEKLALAFGILKSSPGSEVRIQKNIRMCSDCHNWIKSVSRLLNRVIIIRDRIRFHRFEDGLCSCKDYW